MGYADLVGFLVSGRCLKEEFDIHSMIPRATYRLQLNSGFTFADAREQVPYLEQLGISHCYVSPILKARPGSTHGYDIVDHQHLNPELGSRDDFDQFVEALHSRGMGLIADIVPNHMGIGGNDNCWWLDVLENGPASPYAAYFDIDWNPVIRHLQGKVLLPILGNHYGTVLRNRDIKLGFDKEAGTFSAHYYEHLLPIDPKTYPDILRIVLTLVRKEKNIDDAPIRELEDLATGLAGLPSRSRKKRTLVDRRQREQTRYKERLTGCCSHPSIRAAVERALELFNQPSPKDRQGNTLLHRLLEKQAYRLSYWQVAADEINYRRFFSINSLAGLRVEEEEVFARAHNFILDLVEKGMIDGLRIDHIDGLFDPYGYLQRLQKEVAERLAAGGVSTGRPFYLIVEKILASYEYLQSMWPVAGTTGYDFSATVNEFQVPPENEAEFTRLYHAFIEQAKDFHEEEHAAKRLMIKVQLSSELNVLANALRQIAEKNLYHRDFTLNGIRRALAEIVACFPVYRTYITPGMISDPDRQYIDWAVAQAKKRSPAADISIFDFVRDTLLQTAGQEQSYRAGEDKTTFTMKFQQYTSPVMAKAVEDTLFYRYNRLISLNEVGGNPKRFGSSMAVFHRANQLRYQHWPHAMLATSTHDTKRSEDVRSRIAVLAEIPDLWRKEVLQWRKLNRHLRRESNGRTGPDYNDEYLFYQTLVGSWPLAEMEEEGMQEYRTRVEEYMLKAIREAKVHTSWINPNREYEEEVVQFVRMSLEPRADNRFLPLFLDFHRRIVSCGLLNTLGQTLLKMTVPGVPDIYQGNEMWNFSLVDPDNRRLIDYAKRKGLLTLISTEFEQQREGALGLLRQLLRENEEGRLKMYLLWRILQLRKEEPELFSQGDYQPLVVNEPFQESLCVFSRQYHNRKIIVAVPRFSADFLLDSENIAGGFPIPDWAEIELELSGEEAAAGYTELLTNRRLSPRSGEGRIMLPIGSVLQDFPLAVLLRGGSG